MNTTQLILILQSVGLRPSYIEGNSLEDDTITFPGTRNHIQVIDRDLFEIVTSDGKALTFHGEMTGKEVIKKITDSIGKYLHM